MYETHPFGSHNTPSSFVDVLQHNLSTDSASDDEYHSEHETYIRTAMEPGFDTYSSSPSSYGYSIHDPYHFYSTDFFRGYSGKQFQPQPYQQQSHPSTLIYNLASHHQHQLNNHGVNPFPTPPHSPWTHSMAPNALPPSSSTSHPLSTSSYSIIASSDMSTKIPNNSLMVRHSSTSRISSSSSSSSLASLSSSTNNLSSTNNPSSTKPSAAIHTSNNVAPVPILRGRRMLRETSEKGRIFQCEMEGCEKAFKRAEHVKRHMRVHTGERPFVCPHPGCNKYFSRSDNLTQHIRIHTKTIKKASSSSSLSSSFSSTSSFSSSPSSSSSSSLLPPSRSLMPSSSSSSTLSSSASQPLHGFSLEQFYHQQINAATGPLPIPSLKSVPSNNHRSLSPPNLIAS